jgi:MFS transporter, YNFM family, putative membrane transport protein
MPDDESRRARRARGAIAAAGLSSFALLYAPQPVLVQLAAEYDLDPGGASLAISVATGALALGVLPIATLSEFVGRRSVIKISVLASLVVGLLLPLAPNYSALLVLRGIQGVAIAGVAAVAAAYLMEQVGRSGVASAVGLMIAGNTVGGLSGRMASGFGGEQWGWRGGLLAVAIVALAATVVVVVLLPPPRPTDVRGWASPEPNSELLRRAIVGVKAALRGRVVVTQYLVAALGMGGFVAMYNAAGFRLTGAPFDLTPGVASLVFLAYAMGSVSSANAGRLVHRFGRRWALVLALVVTAGGTALTLPPSLPFVVVGFVVLTGGFFAAHAAANSWAVAAAPEHARGQVSGLYAMAYYVGSAAGGTMGGVIYGLGGWTWLVSMVVAWFIVAAGAAAVADAR